MKILFVLDQFGLFEKPYNGASHRNNLFVKSLARLGHVDVCVFNKKSMVSNIDNCTVVFSDLCEERNIYYRNILSLISMFISPSCPESYYRVNKKKKEIVTELLSKNNYDLIACRYIKTAIQCGLLQYASKLIVDIDDNPSLYLRNIAEMVPGGQVNDISLN